MNEKTKEIKIITLGDIFKNIETEDKAFEFLKYIKNLQNKITNLEQEKSIDKYKTLKKLQEENDILKQENERLQEAIKVAQEFNICVGCNNNSDYKSRNEKAIEYIEKSMNNPQPFYEYLFGDENGEVENLDKLLNILNGDDMDRVDEVIKHQFFEIERLNNIIDEIESIVYADMSNIDVRISIQEKLDKLKELKGDNNEK